MPSRPNRWLRVYLDAETAGLSLSARLSGPLSLTLAGPHGVRRPASFPSRTELRDGRAMIKVRFARPGYYRIIAAGPGGSTGWTTLVVLPASQRPARPAAGFPPSGL